MLIVGACVYVNEPLVSIRRGEEFLDYLKNGELLRNLFIKIASEVRSKLRIEASFPKKEDSEMGYEI
jgi:hypothetical protein